MKSGRSLVDLAHELERQISSKRDLVVPSSFLQCRTDEDGSLKLIVDSRQGDGEYGVTGLARRQLADKLKIPFAYFERMRTEQPQLLDRNVNTWLQSDGDRRMIRTLDGQVRAVLSDRYRRLDNFDLAENVLPILQRLEGARFESVELTETKMYLKVITPRVEFEVAPGDIVQAGIVITNSEVGCGTLSVQPLIYRLVCKNGLIASDHALRKTHVGRSLTTEAESVNVFRDDTLAADDRAFFLKVRDVVEAAVSEATFRQVAQKLQKTRDIRLTGDPGEVRRGAGQPLHAQRHRAGRRAAAPHRRRRSQCLWSGQRRHALLAGRRGLRPCHRVRGAGRQAHRAGPRRLEGVGPRRLRTPEAPLPAVLRDSCP
jgi:hypothetical protein